MRASLAASLLAAGGGALAEQQQQQQQQKPLGRLTQLLTGTRQRLSCEATYSAGWEKCGDRNSIFCYDPTSGQSCCAVDDSHCDKGTWCAPVAGYCCLDSEDLAACAKNAGFKLTDIMSVGDLPMAATPKSASPGTQPQEPVAMLSNRPDLEISSPPTGTRSNPHLTPHVQVSTAGREEQRTRTRMALGIGVVGLFMLFC
ncbi:hypothetical protein BT67DRAFT_190634 [Trichocladium antarcticum]|uniref:Uncharacterized protein n=1 Tax=Trichocladium antarcticum TaxID=1450529 RepID=A0AAN6ZFT5_9PEZI|nr:hypothetical protein BT67DRAFT_190634 [Trichocladium antarcticum]